MTANLPIFDWPAKLPRTCGRDMLVLAVKEWATGASTEDLSAILNVPVSGVKRYTNLPGWHAVVQQLRAELDQEAENRLQRGLRLALTQLEDRLEHGNKGIDRKTGRAIRVPLSASDLSSIAGTLFDKKAHARKIVDGIPEHVPDAAESLASIANLLRKHATFTPQPNTIDVTPQKEEAA